MKFQFFIRLLSCLFCLLILMSAGLARAALPVIAEELLYNHRRLIVLTEAPPHLRAEARRAGHYLFVRNQHLLRELVQEMQRGSAASVPGRYGEFIRAADKEVRAEGDRLALRAPLRALIQAGVLQGDALADAQQRLRAIGELRRRYGADAEADVPVGGAADGKTARPLWNAYVRTLMQETPVERVIVRLDDEIFGAFPDTTDHAEAAARARFLEWDGTELPPRSVLLTFDDGPHASNTPRVLDILQAQGVHAIFYLVGRNAGSVQDGKPIAGPNADLVRRMAAEGHAVGNHSFSHPVLPKLDNPHLKREVEDTQRLIEALAPAPARTATLRPPFGARNDRVLAEIDGHRLRSVMWNVDSLDWADPVPESIVQRVLREVDAQGGGIILMHDIHVRTVDALPRIIRALKERGYAFLRWDGARLVRDVMQ